MITWRTRILRVHDAPLSSAFTWVRGKASFSIPAWGSRANLLLLVESHKAPVRPLPAPAIARPLPPEAPGPRIVNNLIDSAVGNTDTLIDIHPMSPECSVDASPNPGVDMRPDRRGGRLLYESGVDLRHHATKMGAWKNLPARG